MENENVLLLNGIVNMSKIRSYEYECAFSVTIGSKWNEIILVDARAKAKAMNEQEKSGTKFTSFNVSR